jgi:hypothetical protein
MSTELLDLHVKLLVLEHGRSRVLSSLARAAEVSEADVHRDLAAIKPKTPKPRLRPTIDELLAKIDVPSSRRDAVHTLAREFEQKRFLGEGRLVAKFFREHGVRANPKSRMDALPKILTVLASLPEDDLRNMVAELANNGGASGYADLAGAIMGSAFQRR